MEKYKITEKTIVAKEIIAIYGLGTETQRFLSNDGKDLNILKLSSRNNNVVTGVITVEGELDVSKPYTVEIDGYGEIAAVPTDIFDSAAFVQNYTYDGDDLGAVIQGDETVFKVWAPTASSVKL